MYMLEGLVVNVVLNMGADLYINCGSCGGINTVAVHNTNEFETGCDGKLHAYSHAVCTTCKQEFK